MNWLLTVILSKSVSKLHLNKRFFVGVKEASWKCTLEKWDKFKVRQQEDECQKIHGFIN